MNKDKAARVLSSNPNVTIRFYTYEGEEDEGLSYYLTPESPEFNDKFIYVEFNTESEGQFTEALIDL